LVNRRAFKACGFFLAVSLLLSSCAMQQPYAGTNPENPQFERGISVPPLDFFGDMLSKLPQLLFWDLRYGNHRISADTEKTMAEFLRHYQVTDVKVRINQWAPHKEIKRLITNPHVAWPYKIIFFPSTLITSLLGRPFGGLLISDYYDPGSNTIHIFSDHPAIALHEAGHALDFSRKELKGTYALGRVLPGMNLFQESIASDEAIFYLESTGQYEKLFQAYKILYPAYATYLVSYFSSAPPAYIGAIIIGHWAGRFKAREKEWALKVEGKIDADRRLITPAETPSIAVA
jgi:hypothetical protein